jgi:type VII secretion-associated protein (TIGR03931 family)
VTGELQAAVGLSIVDATEAGWDLPAVAGVVAGSAVAAGALARGLDVVAQVPAAPEAVAPVVRRSRWDTVGRWGPLVAAGVLVVAAITAVVVVAGGGDPRASAEPEPEPEQEAEVRAQAQAPAHAGRASVAVPRGWRERSGRVDAARVELVPEKAAAARILVVTQELTPGADLEAVAHTLRLRTEERPETFTALERGVVDGRPGLLYREKPDPDTEVRWSVFVEDGLQVSVGCQISPERWRDLAGPCEQAVRSTAIAGR